MLGLFGLVLLSLHLLMLIGSVVVLFLVGVWFWVGVVLLLELLSLVVIRFGRIVAMLLTLMMLLMSFCIVLLDLRRRLKAVMELVDAMIRYGVSLSRSIELSAQWDRILIIGPLFPVTLDDFQVLRGVGLGDFYHGVCGIHRRLGDFIHCIVVHRRDEAIRGWRNWIREDPPVHPYEWLRPDLVPPALFFSVNRIFHLVVLVFYLILLGLMRNSERPGFPIFAALGKGRPALRNSMMRLRGSYLCYQRFLCLV